MRNGGLFHLALICLVTVLGVSAPAAAQSDAQTLFDHFVQCANAQSEEHCRAMQQLLQREVDQCSKAVSTNQCQASLPACQRVLAFLDQIPAEALVSQLVLVRRSLLSHVTDCEIWQTQYLKAETHLVTELSLARRIYGPEHPVVAGVTFKLALSFEGQGKYAAAEGLYRQALAIAQKDEGSAQESVPGILNRLAEVLYEQGKYADAETHHKRALWLRQKLFGTVHRDVAESMSNLAHVLAVQCKYKESESLFRQSLAMMQQVYGPEHKEVAATLNDFALLRQLQGMYQEAEALHRQSLAMRKKLLAPEHREVIQSMTNLGLVLNEQGLFASAETQFREALTTQQKHLGSEHPEVAINLSNLAGVLNQQGKSAESELLFRQSLRIRQQSLGPQHPDVARDMLGLAAVRDDTAQHQDAFDLRVQALRIFEKALGSEARSVADVHEQLAWLYYRDPRSDSELHARLALGIKQKVLGFEHPGVATAARTLAIVLAYNGQFQAALPFITLAEQIAEISLRNTASETRMRLRLDQIGNFVDVLYGILWEQPTDEKFLRLAITSALLRKGRAAEAGTLANQIFQKSRDDPRRKELFERWQEVRQQREALLFGDPGKLSPSAYQQLIKQLGQQADDLESQVAAVMPELRTVATPKFNDIVGEVAARLPKDGALVEIQLVKPYNFNTKRTAESKKPSHYVALVMTPDQQIVMKDLGEATTVDSQVQALLSALRSPVSDPVKSGKTLYAQILKPVLPQAVKHLYLSLDGSLSLIPFDALHDGKDYLLGRWNFHYLTSGRDLLRTDSEPAKTAAILIADPDFGQAGKDQASGGTETFYQRLAGLTRLPGAQQEAKQIGALLKVLPMVGTTAKESVIREAQAPWVLHIATHGLFLKGQDLPRIGGRGVGLFGSSFTERKLVPLADTASASFTMGGGANSLSRSALVLADAASGDNAKNAAEDGLLTAEEARSLNLFGTQLVVLSACDTGQGELSVGQGVYGLRRAFLVAGAETLVTSLWQVNDTATGKLMTLYYQKLLKQRKGRLAAMQGAMQEMRKKYKHPYYWAPFLVVGSDGPMRLPGQPLPSSQLVQKELQAGQPTESKAPVATQSKESVVSSASAPSKNPGTTDGRTEGGSVGPESGASSPKAEAGGPAKSESRSDLPRPRSMDEFQTLSIKQLRAADLSSCGAAGEIFGLVEVNTPDGVSRFIQLHIELSPNGEVISASGLDGPGGACMLRVIRGIRFPPLPPDEVHSVKLSIRIALPGGKAP